MRRLRDLILKQKCLPYPLYSWARSCVQERRVRQCHLDAMGARFFNRPSCKVYSFDVFDTVLARSTATHLGIFALMQKTLAQRGSGVPDGLVKAFLSWRTSAEEEAGRLFTRVCTLDDIYQPLVNEGVISDEQKSSLIDMEQMLEYDKCFGIPRIVELIRSLRKQGARIVFVSDMYLSSLQIRRMLEKAGCVEQGDRVYVSNEHDATKAAGTLYDVVLEQEGVRPHQLVHIGNHYEVDILQARKKRIRAVYFTDADLNQHEQQLRSYLKPDGHDNELDGELLAGLAKQTRLSRLEHKAYERAVYELGASFAGPVLTAFVLWTLQTAHAHGIKRLYFIARDGQILYQIAQKLIGRLGLDIDLRYLYGSRHAWFLPSLSDLTSHDVDWLTMRHSYLSLRVIANRTGMDADYLRERFASQTNAPVELDQDISRFDREVKELLSTPEVKARILEGAARKRPLVAGYLRQEGLLDDVPFSIVDLGWRGTLQRAVTKVIDSVSSRERVIYGMYFGVDLLEADRVCENNIMLSYSFATHDSIPAHWRIKDILEFMASGDHGLVLGYEHDRGSYVPHLKEKGNGDVETWGLRDLQRGIQGFVDSLLAQKDFDVTGWDVEHFRRVVHGMFEGLVNHTTTREAEIIGRYPYKRDSFETFVEEYAPRFNLPHAFEHLMHPERQVSSWMKVTYLRSSLAVRVLLRAQQYGHIQRMIRTIRPFVRLTNKGPRLTTCNTSCVAQLHVPEYAPQFLWAL